MINTFIITTGVLFISWIVYRERKFRKEQMYTYLFLRNKEKIDNAHFEFRRHGSTVEEAAAAFRAFGKALSGMTDKIKIEKL